MEYIITLSKNDTVEIYIAGENAGVLTTTNYCFNCFNIAGGTDAGNGEDIEQVLINGNDANSQGITNLGTVALLGTSSLTLGLRTSIADTISFFGNELTNDIIALNTATSGQCRIYGYDLTSADFRDMAIGGSSINGDTGLFIGADDNIGIGTDTPTRPLEVSKSLSGGYVGWFQNNDTGSFGNGLAVEVATAVANKNLQLWRVNGIEVARLESVGGVFATKATNAEIGANPENLINKAYADLNYSGMGATSETIQFSRDFGTGNPSGNQNMFPGINDDGTKECFCVPVMYGGTVLEAVVFCSQYVTSAVSTMIFDVYKRTKGTFTASPDGPDSAPASTTKIGEIEFDIPDTSSLTRYSTSFDCTVNMTGTVVQGDQLFIVVQSFFGFVSQSVEINIKVG